MKIIKQSYEVMTPINGVEIVKFLELCGRVCYKSEDKITEDSAQRMIKALLKSGHHSVIEHFNVTVRFITDRGVTHELVRHRLCAFSQESTRFCNYGGDDIQFILPVWIDNLAPLLNTETHNNTDLSTFLISTRNWIDAMLSCENSYQNAIIHGWPPQYARSVLPNSLKTEIITTANLREWRHILALRAVGTSGKLHPQMQQLMLPLLKEFKENIPVLFDDLYKEAFEKGLY